MAFYMLEWQELKKWQALKYCKAISFLSKSVRRQCCQLSAAQHFTFWNIFDENNQSCFASCVTDCFQTVWDSLIAPFTFIYYFSIFATCYLKCQLFICFITLLNYPLSLSYTDGADWSMGLCLIYKFSWSYEQNSWVLINNFTHSVGARFCLWL